MPMIFFIQIGMAAGLYGLMKMIQAGTDQRMAKEINMRAGEILDGITAEGGETMPVPELEPMAGVIKRKGASAAKMGLLAAAGAYGLAGILAAAGRSSALSRPGGMAVIEKYTVLSILGNGSQAAAAAVLAGIAAGVAAAVMGNPAGRKAEENLERAYSNLFLAKRNRREKIEKERNDYDREDY